MLKRRGEFFRKRMNKRAMEMEEIVKIIIAVVILALLVVGTWVLLKIKGGEALSVIKNFLRFGR